MGPLTTQKLLGLVKNSDLGAHLDCSFRLYREEAPEDVFSTTSQVIFRTFSALPTSLAYATPSCQDCFTAKQNKRTPCPAKLPSRLEIPLVELGPLS